MKNKLKEILRKKLAKTLQFEGIAITMSVAKAIDEFIDVEVDKALISIRKETLKEVEKLLPYSIGFTDRFYKLKTKNE